MLIIHANITIEKALNTIKQHEKEPHHIRHPSASYFWVEVDP